MNPASEILLPEADTNTSVVYKTSLQYKFTS